MTGAPESDEDRVLRIARFLFADERTLIKVDTVEDGLVTFKPEPGERGQRIALIEDVLDERGPFKPAP